MRRPLLVGALVAAVITLVASAVAVAGAINGGASPRGFGAPTGSSQAAPRLPGTVVNISLTNMGGPMMGQRRAMMFRGAMRLTADRDTVPHGTVSFLVTNQGNIKHEMVVLPLPDSQAVGTRPIQGGAKIDEEGSLGEASTTNGKGAGEGILPHASSWVSTTLARGHYELVCNLAGHYTAGMHTQLTVT